MAVSEAMWQAAFSRYQDLAPGYPLSRDGLRAALEAAFAVSPAADMLAALKAMVAWFDDDDSFCLSDEDSCDNCVERRKEWRIACAAIARAEGRTEATDA